MDRRFPKFLQEYIHEWATVTALQKWEEYTAAHPEGGPWLSSEDMGALTRYLRDYLCSDAVFDQVSKQLLKIVGLRLRDEAAKRRARRKYVRIVMNDYLLNPGPSAELTDKDAETDDLDEYGLMGDFVHRWRARLPLCLAAGAGSVVHIPPGNTELIELLEPYDV